MNLSKNSTNKEITDSMNLSDGKTRIFAIEPTSNPNYSTIFACQQVKGGGATAAQELLLGWGNRIVRAIHNADAKIASKYKVGDNLPLDILSEEKTTPAYEGQKPKVNPSTSEVITFEGKDVYEHGSLVAAGEGKVIRLERTTVATPVLLA